MPLSNRFTSRFLNSSLILLALHLGFAFCDDECEEKKKLNLLQYSTLATALLVCILAILTNVYVWMFFYTVYIKICRSMKSFDEKLSLAMDLMNHRKFSDDMIGQLSVAAKFDPQGDNEAETNWQSKIETLMPNCP
ncbi:hypothetical protein Ddc_24149 [Ditylenchus destructor]|nr:hypothetical protein Ddc_24149 [Ditylenchus destructor]